MCVRAYTESQILCFVLPFISHRADEKKKKKQKKLFGSVFFSENAKHFLRTEWHRLVNKRLECVQTYIMDV